MKLYVYNPDTIITIIDGDTNAECERKAIDAGYGDSDIYGWTYSPAFGTIDGLKEATQC